jgi:hypothetical protein
LTMYRTLDCNSLTGLISLSGAASQEHLANLQANEDSAATMDITRNACMSRAESA